MKTKSKLLLLLSVLVGLWTIVFNSSPVNAQNPPTVTVAPPAGPVGIPVTAMGSDFTPGATVDLYWFGYIVDVQGVNGSLGYYPIKTGVTVGPDGSFATTIITPYDFSDFLHFVNATQNGVGTGIINATFTIVPSLHLSPQPANYTDGQEALLHVYGGPLGTPAFLMGLSMLPEPTVIKFTYDNMFWGFATSHLETEGPIVTGGFIGGDVGGNITVRFKTIGLVGKHNIRGFVGGKETSPYVSCEIGGEAEFYILGPSLDTQTILNSLASLDATILSVQGDTATIKTNLGTINASLSDIDTKIVDIQGDTATIETSLGTITGTVTSVDNGVATIQTDLGTMTISVDGVKGSTDSAVNYGLGALALSAINLIILLVVVYRVFKKTP